MIACIPKPLPVWTHPSQNLSVHKQQEIISVCSVFLIPNPAHSLGSPNACGAGFPHFKASPAWVVFAVGPNRTRRNETRSCTLKWLSSRVWCIMEGLEVKVTRVENRVLTGLVYCFYSTSFMECRTLYVLVTEPNWYLIFGDDADTI